jgi:hypothetical protein
MESLVAEILADPSMRKNLKKAVVEKIRGELYKELKKELQHEMKQEIQKFQSDLVKSIKEDANNNMQRWVAKHLEPALESNQRSVKSFVDHAATNGTLEKLLSSSLERLIYYRLRSLGNLPMNVTVDLGAMKEEIDF